mmetsp:Transcript_65234/g.183624  ORF Transcript_65234/g.183624 Transcript_65234/m.183624 type:complete len:372 (+) Transcript_65234:77-1192(+)
MAASCASGGSYGSRSISRTNSKAPTEVSHLSAFSQTSWALSLHTSGDFNSPRPTPRAESDAGGVIGTSHSGTVGVSGLSASGSGGCVKRPPRPSSMPPGGAVGNGAGDMSSNATCSEAPPPAGQTVPRGGHKKGRSRSVSLVDPRSATKEPAESKQPSRCSSKEPSDDDYGLRSLMGSASAAVLGCGGTSLEASTLAGSSIGSLSDQEQSTGESPPLAVPVAADPPRKPAISRSGSKRCLLGNSSQVKPAVGIAVGCTKVVTTSEPDMLDRLVKCGSTPRGAAGTGGANSSGRLRTPEGTPKAQRQKCLPMTSELLEPAVDVPQSRKITSTSPKGPSPLERSNSLKGSRHDLGRSLLRGAGHSICNSPTPT